MQDTDILNPNSIARSVGLGLLASIILGILGSIFVVDGIDVNLTADILATAENMLEAEQRLKAKAYLGLLAFALEALISVGLYLLLRKSGPFWAGCALFISIGAAVLMLFGSVFAMNAAKIASNVAFQTLTDETGRTMLASLQATSDYTSFHLGLILTTAANAIFFYLFFKSGLIPKLIAGWGLFASIFVVTVVIARDFIPVLGHNTLTAVFMVSNLIALVSTGLYLAIRGVRAP
ncbi:MAG: DUF4386 domain-containing protein [Maricaulaceae bacterium]